MSKTLYGIYAIVAYTIGMASLVYLMAFMVDVAVPKTINGGPSAPLPGGILTNLLVLVAFLVPHSVMARPRFKACWTRIVPATLERTTYILISGITTLLMLWAWQPLPATLWQLDSPILSTAAYGVYALGWLTIVLATFNIDHFAFFGLRQVWDRIRDRAHVPAPFTVRFLYGRIRHPISLGWLMVFWATPHMTTGHLLFALSMTIYIAVVTPIEEADLIDALGEDYRRYKQRVRAFLPWPRKAPGGPQAAG